MERARLGVSEVAGLVALDRLSVSFPVTDYEPAVFTAKSEQRDAFTGKLRTESLSTVVPFHRPGGEAVERSRARRGAAYIGVQYRPGLGIFGKVEANPAPWFADDYAPLPFGRLEDAVAEVGRLLDLYGIAPASAESWKVNRVDFLRTIDGVSSPERTLSALETPKRKYRPVVALWSDAHRKGAQTLALRTGSGVVRAYDGHAAYGLAEGTVRAEIQANQGWLRRVGIERLGDMTEFQCQALIAERWNWSRLGDAVTSGRDAVDRIVGHVRAGGYLDAESGEWQKVSATMAKSLLGEMLLEAAGVHVEQAKATNVKYARWRRNLGVTLDLEEVLRAEDYVSRLDFVGGCEVVERRAPLRLASGV